MSKPSDEVRLIRALRLRGQGLVPGVQSWESPPEVARGMVAMQAQDPKGVLWALSVRSAGRPDEAAVTGDLAAGAVVRNRPSRGTLQVTAPEDLHWLTGLLAARSNAAAVKRRDQLGVTQSTVDAVGEVLRNELAGGRTRTRPELVAACAAAGVPLDGSQAGHILRHHTETMTVVFAAPQGRSDTFALADEWIGTRRELDRDGALAELALRYFTSRGAATAQCLSWWGNLTMGDVRSAIAGAGSALEEVELAGETFVVDGATANLTPAEVDAALAEPHLLAPFDEYLLGYRSRDAVITAERLDAVVPGRNGMFKPIVVVDGEVVGLWSRKATTKSVTVTVEPFSKLPASAADALAQRADCYGAFLGRRATLEMGVPTG
ncbi:MAG: winged helix DNA-binding domain-containing protein [Microthrixaceae bacterium]